MAKSHAGFLLLFDQRNVCVMLAVCIHLYTYVMYGLNIKTLISLFYVLFMYFVGFDNKHFFLYIKETSIYFFAWNFLLGEYHFHFIQYHWFFVFCFHYIKMEYLLFIDFTQSLNYKWCCWFKKTRKKAAKSVCSLI